MNQQTVSAIFGLFAAIATMCAVFCILGGFCYAVTRVFTDRYPQ